MPTPLYQNYISQVTLPNNVTYHVKDAEARQWINDIAAGGLTFVVAWDGSSAPVVANIPAGAVVKYQSETYVGTLAASASTKPNIYLVYSDVTATGRDIYEEYVTVNFGTTAEPNYGWEVLGNTDISLDVLGDLAWKDSVTLNKGSGDKVLGEATTFTNASSSVTFTGGTTAEVITSYPGTSSKLETASITGVGADVTFTAVKSSSDHTVTNTVFGTATTASKVATETKTATNTVLGTATKASKATAGTAVTLAKPASSATAVSYIGNAETSSVLDAVSVTGETLTFSSASVSQSSVTGTNGSESITPYTFTEVTVPVVTSNTEVSISSVKTNTDVSVPVVSSNTAYTASEIVTESKTAATSAASATTVATGSLKADDTVGATVMTGLGTASKETVVKTVGTGTAAAQTITVGTNDKIDVAKYNDLSITVS